MAHEWGVLNNVASDLRGTPRVRAYFDFFIAELPTIRPLLNCKAAKLRGKKLAKRSR